MASVRPASAPLGNAHALGTRRPRRRRVGCRHGHRTLRLHPDPAADATVAWRASLVVLAVTLAAMPLLPNTIGWLLLRTVAGFASALVFVVAVNSMLDHLPPHLPGWGFGGVGLGIALSGALVLTMPAEAGWQGAWWTAAAVAAVLSAGAWAMQGTSRPGAVPPPAPPSSPRRANRWFAVLFVSYTLGRPDPGPSGGDNSSPPRLFTRSPRGALVVVLSALVAGLLRFGFPPAGAGLRPAATSPHHRQRALERRG